MERYHIAGVLGDGSFGTVYDATLVKGGERVAIKRLKAKFESWNACTRLREVRWIKENIRSRLTYFKGTAWGWSMCAPNAAPCHRRPLLLHAILNAGRVAL
jgi:hypothetical protein